MSLKVLVTSVLAEPPLYVESTQRKIVVGRELDVDVRLPDPTVSGRHASLRKRGSSYFLVDEGSLNGTAVLSQDGAEAIWLSPDSPRVVADGTRILIGQVELELRVDSEVQGSASDDLARDLVTLSLAGLDLEVTEEMLDSALEELTSLPDEALEDRPADEPTATDQGGVVEDAEPRLNTDLALVAVAAVFALLCLAGLYWLLFVR